MVSWVPCSTGAHEGGSYSDCVGGGGGTTLYLLPGLVVFTVAASTPSGWDLSGSTYGRSPQVGVYVEVDVCLPFGIASPLKLTLVSEARITCEVRSWVKYTTRPRRWFIR